MKDRDYMLRALELARLAEGNTSPNPMVGCVIVNSEGIIVGEGYHHKAGEAHAEVNALKMAQNQSEGATAYVTLEPCSHYGRTGPCCLALAEAGIRKVVVACQDPNPKVAGNGIRYLQEQGIEVICGVCEKEARRLNEKFMTWITEKRPFISLKYAMTLDGKIAAYSGDSKWITGVEARTYAHLLRKQHDAILVGIGTVLKDDPELTTRLVEGKNPVRIVLDSHLSIPLTAKVLNSEARTIIFTGLQIDEVKAEQLAAYAHVEVIKTELLHGEIDIQQVIAALAQKELTSLLVEGGSNIHGAFFSAGYGDRIYAFIAPKLVGGKNGYTPVGGSGCALIKDGWQLDSAEYQQLGQDLLITGLVQKE